VVPPPPALLHGGSDTLAGVAVELGLFGALLLMAFALVRVHEDRMETRWKWAWAGLIVLVPVIGPTGYLWRRRTDR
jgi:hypothetical protein